MRELNPELKDFCQEDQPKARKLLELLDKIYLVLHPEDEGPQHASESLQ